MIKTIFFADDSVFVLDQNQLPGQVVYEQCHTPAEIARAIKMLKVRGAPLIGVTAAFGMVLAARNYQGKDLKQYLQETAALLVSTRPTAVNLLWAIKRMLKVIDAASTHSSEEIVQLLTDEALLMYEEDIAINRAIGHNGQELLGPGSRVMTICNAGALATCGYGTALGVIRAAHERGKIDMVWACETRPVLQGSRLTVWELTEDNIPVTLITDNMAGYTMARQHIDAVITGADRVAANGDTANKIGTYSLAVLAFYHHIPFYIAAPLSTFDTSKSSGGDIPIEERDADEVRQVGGQLLTVSGAKVFNPAFDITPYQLITGIITEKGIIKPPFRENINSKFQELNQ
ncbi:MAG: S-methyl-5-thioribose-1-phosphate isomerase [Syntrophomonadaceae bacterium]|jgi:methylthioribose-1-phosphate isomerase